MASDCSALSCFLNYYLQEILGYSPIMIGVAFLPMVATLVLAGGVSTTQLYPRLDAKIPVVAGMLIAAAGMAWLTGIGRHSSYGADILGPLMLFGLGIGAIMAPSMNAGTSGVEPRDAGVASATVNIAQQIGGSIGVALLNSVAASALTHAVADKDAAIHSYTAAFWCSSAIFVADAVACGLILRSGKPVVTE